MKPWNDHDYLGTISFSMSLIVNLSLLPILILAGNLPDFRKLQRVLLPILKIAQTSLGFKNRSVVMSIISTPKKKLSAWPFDSFIDLQFVNTRTFYLKCADSLALLNCCDCRFFSLRSWEWSFLILFCCTVNLFTHIYTPCLQAFCEMVGFVSPIMPASAARMVLFFRQKCWHLRSQDR